MSESPLCPVCKAENSFSELRVVVYDVKISNDAEIQDSEYADFIHTSLVYCRECSSYLEFDKDKKKWRKATKEEIYITAFEGLSIFLDKGKKETYDALDEMKKYALLGELK